MLCAQSAAGVSTLSKGGSWPRQRSSFQKEEEQECGPESRVGAGEEQEGQLHVCKGPGARWPLVLGAQESRGPGEKQRGRLQAPHNGGPNLSKPRADGGGAGVVAGTQPERRGAGSQGRAAWRAPIPPQTPGTRT